MKYIYSALYEKGTLEAFILGAVSEKNMEDPDRNGIIDTDVSYIFVDAASKKFDPNGVTRIHVAPGYKDANWAFYKDDVYNTFQEAFNAFKKEARNIQNAFKVTIDDIVDPDLDVTRPAIKSIF